MHLICELRPLIRGADATSLGNVLERTREILPHNTSDVNQSDNLASKDDNTDDTVFEVDPITHVQLDKSPLMPRS